MSKQDQHAPVPGSPSTSGMAARALRHSLRRVAIFIESRPGLAVIGLCAVGAAMWFSGGTGQKLPEVSEAPPSFRYDAPARDAPARGAPARGALSRGRASRYLLEVSANDDVFVINGERFQAQTYCFDMREGDPIVFLKGSPLGACASAELLNTRNGRSCKVWCE